MLYNSALLIFCGICINIIFSAGNLLAAEVLRTAPPRFGTIDLHPGGDLIRIDARNGTAVAQSIHPTHRSIITGSRSGLLRIISDSNAEEHVDIIFQNAILLTGPGSTISIKAIDTYSQYSSGGVDIPAGGYADISIGGEIELTGEESNGQYSGNLSITLHFQ